MTQYYNESLLFLKKYSLTSLILFIIVLFYIRSNFLKLTIFIPIITTLFVVFFNELNNRTILQMIFMLIIYFFMCINYKNQNCKENNKKDKSSSFKSGLLVLIPYLIIVPLTVIVLKIYPRDEFINIFGETYGVLANRMKLIPGKNELSESIIKYNNGVFLWLILTGLYMTHVSEMVLVLNEC